MTEAKETPKVPEKLYRDSPIAFDNFDIKSGPISLPDACPLYREFEINGTDQWGTVSLYRRKLDEYEIGVAFGGEASYAYRQTGLPRIEAGRMFLDEAEIIGIITTGLKNLEAKSHSLESADGRS